MVRGVGGVAQPLGQGRADLAQGETREAFIQDPGHLLRRAGGEVGAGLDEDRPHRAAPEVEHQEQPVGADLREVELVEHHFLESRRHRHPQLLRQHAQDLRRPPEQLFDGGAMPRQLGGQGVAFTGADLSDRPAPEEVIDVEPIGQVGRDPAGTGVGMEEVPLHLELAHRGADRGRRHAEAVPLGERLAPGRLRGRDIFLDHGFEDLQFALGEVGDGGHGGKIGASARGRLGAWNSPPGPLSVRPHPPAPSPLRERGSTTPLARPTHPSATTPRR